MTKEELEAAREFINQASQLYKAGSKEAVLIRNLVSSLPSMFPKGTTWLAHHVRDAEHQIQYGSDSGERRAFIDSLVGYTTIEYEHDLTKRAVFQTGYKQVRQHVAGLLNANAPQDKIIGILADTIHWRAYRTRNVRKSGPVLRPEDIDLEEIDRLDLTQGSDQDPERLITFLAKYLGRDGARRLAASTVAFDVGFETEFARGHLSTLGSLVQRAFDERPDYADIVKKLWSDFVAYIGEAGKDRFDRDLYVSELYVVTLAKLLCANIVSGGGLNSDDAELTSVLDGSYFRARGLENLVEYDYFGWLNAQPYVRELLPVAREIQRGLRRYDFDAPAGEDLFGQLLAQLAKHSQRLLLGQEATPPWLARRMANQLLGALPENEPPRFIDMCCGSGSMIVEVVLAQRQRFGGSLDPAAIAELTQVATGFDIDPLAVMLAKVNWVAASRNWLAPFDGTRRISIPIYLADSMFAKTPIGEVDAGSDDPYRLMLHQDALELPSFLVSPEFRALFDALIDRAHSIAMTAAQGDAPVDGGDVRVAIDEACTESAVVVTTERRTAVTTFLVRLVDVLAELQRQQLNGIWAFVLRNSYRPGLVLGQFNGLISNPPWLALSKFADNPYRELLRREAEAYGIKAPASSFLHVELATTFLLHSIDRYLRDGAVIGCVLPGTIINGAQHEPFRRALYNAAPKPVALTIEQLWRVQTGTFKNEALVLIGKRQSSTATSFPGALVGADAVEQRTFRTIKLGPSRSAWSDSTTTQAATGYNEVEFRQGADVMPRTAIFHDVTLASGGRVTLRPIDKTSDLGYLVSDAKKMAGFRLTPTTVPDRFVFDVLLSKHVVPFEITSPARGLLPFERDDAGRWRPVLDTRLAASPQAKAAFDEILRELGRAEGHPMTVQDYFRAVDTNYRKLDAQLFGDTGYLVVFGAGGSYVTAAYAPLSEINADRLIVDQTLYWTVAQTEDEAFYLTGLLNSPALDRAIAEFQPQGQFGRRHIHELPLHATPGFDPKRPLHIAVVNATRSLVGEYRAARKDPALGRYFTHTLGIASRRRVLRTNILPALPSYRAYASACDAVYADSGAIETPIPEQLRQPFRANETPRSGGETPGGLRV